VGDPADADLAIHRTQHLLASNARRRQGFKASADRSVDVRFIRDEEDTDVMS